MTNLYAPPQATVQDIDPTAGILLADRGARFGAAMLDGIIFMLMVYAPLIVAALLSGGTRAASSGNDSGAGFGIGMVAALIGFLVWLAINIKFMKANGQSIGKKACAIKVVRHDGSAVSLSRLIWLRNAVNLMLGMVPLYGIIDALFILGDARRCVHDHLADTIVIKA